MRKLSVGLLTVMAVMMSSMGSANASNYPCSGAKGGIARCDGGQFICNDGTTSRSEQVCTTELKNSINKSAGIGAGIGAGVVKQSSKPSAVDSIKETGDNMSKTAKDKASKATDKAKTAEKETSKAVKDKAKATATCEVSR